MPRTAGITIHCKLHAPSSKEETPIFFLIQKGGKRYKFFPGLKVNPSIWNTGKGRAKTGLHQTAYINLNDSLDQTEKVISEVWRKHAGQFTPKTFPDFVREELKNAGHQETFGPLDFLLLITENPEAAADRWDEMGEKSKALVQDAFKAISENQRLKNRVLGKGEDVLSLINFIPVFLEKRKDQPDAKWQTTRNLYNFYFHLAAYFSQAGELDYDEIVNNYEFREDFCHFLYSHQEFTFPFPKGLELVRKGKRGGEPLSQVLRLFNAEGNFQYRKPPMNVNTVNKGLAIIMQFVSEARRKKHTKATFDRGFNVRKEVANKIVLYFDEWEKIAKKDLRGIKALEDTRIRAFVGGFTGMRESDWDKLRKDMVKSPDGEKMLEVYTQKTGEPVAIPFLPVFERLLESVNYEIPAMWPQDFNERFKELCEYCEINDVVEYIDTTGGVRRVEKLPKWKVVTSHACRRSFASNFTLPPVNLSKMVAMQITGHSSEAMFNKYCNHSKRLTATMVSQEFQRQRAQWLYAIKEAK